MGLGLIDGLKNGLNSTLFSTLPDGLKNGLKKWGLYRGRPLSTHSTSAQAVKVGTSLAHLHPNASVLDFVGGAA